MNVKDFDIKSARFKGISHKVKDPVRYPNVVNGYEGEAIKEYNSIQNRMFVDVTKKMVEIQNKKNR